MTLRYGEDCHVFHCAGVKLRGANQITHIFQNHQVGFTGIQTVQTLAGHSRIQVAHAAGVELDGLGAGGGDSDSIHIRVNVRLHNTDLQVLFQKLNQPGQGGGFAASGRRHQVQKIDSLLLQFFPKFLCLGIVVCEYTLLNFQNSFLFQKHRSFLVIPA